MDYHFIPVLESFFTNDMMIKILEGIKANGITDTAWNKFWFVYQAKAFYDEEITDNFSNVLKKFYYGLIDLDQEDILILLMEVNPSGATYSSGYRDLCPLSYAVDRNNNKMAKRRFAL